LKAVKSDSSHTRGPQWDEQLISHKKPGRPEDSRMKGQTAERKRTAAENTLPRKTVIQNREVKSFPDKQKLTEFMTTKPAQHKMLKRGLFQGKGQTISMIKKSRRHKSSKIKNIYKKKSRDSQNIRI